MRKERQILVRRVLLDIRVRRAKQRNEDIDENDCGQEVPAVVHNQAERVAESLVR